MPNGYIPRQSSYLGRAIQRFDLYSVLRRIEATHPELPRLGNSRLPKQDPIRLGQSPYLKFPNATLEKTEQDPSGKPWLKNYCFGLFGPNGPLPLHLTEYAFERIQHAKDPGFAAFCDLFHHRFISLFYRAWADKEPTVNYDRPQQDRFAFYLGCLEGYGLPSQQARDAMPERGKRHFIAHLARHPRNAEGLIAIVSAFFGVKAEVKQFVGEWLPIPEQSLSRLGEAVLGETVIGNRSYQRASKFTLHLGPLSQKEFTAFLPCGECLSSLVAIVRNWIGDGLAWDLNLILKGSDIPPPRLSGEGRLGWSFWLGGGESEPNDRDNLTLNPIHYHTGMMEN